MVLRQDTPERIVFESSLTHSKVFAGCMIPLLSVVLPLGLMIVTGDHVPPQGLLIGAGMILGALWGIVKMVQTLTRPKSVYRIVLEPPQRKVSLQTLVGTQLTAERIFGLSPNAEFAIYSNVYHLHTRAGTRTRYATNICYDDPVETVELWFSLDQNEGEAFTSRLRESFGMDKSDQIEE